MDQAQSSADTAQDACSEPAHNPLRRRWVLGTAAVAAGYAAGPWPIAQGQERFPSRPLRIIVPWAAGTPPDVSSRIVSAKLQDVLKQPVIVENKPGASGTVGMTELVRAPADGYTLGVLHYAAAAVATLFPRFKVDLAKDLIGIGLLDWSHNVLVVSPSLGVQSVQELIEYLRKTPSEYASSGVGSPAHLSGVMFVKAAGVQATHVAYNQFGQAIADVATGRVAFMVLASVAAVPQVLGGKLRALAVTGPQRNPSLRDVPTVSELKFPGMQSRTWEGLVVRSETPKDIVDRLSKDLATVMAMPDVREALVKQQAELPTESAEQFRELIRRDVTSGAEFVKANNIKIE